ncbi:MAG: hypothetical protein KJ904_05500 [Alphaproteobacteria bacterium]|nr:hypothetical protein [Alphaproteobacteria bacterium]MBU0797611.1 hypothetical protein [Alphaproteobacteria bacterium]MBU0886601.1 hypothetical protein [Alphaproteobacteria bacterium]MBU1812574.1 hypothetical protein [Alphaproteobacteria bacterium]
MSGKFGFGDAAKMLKTKKERTQDRPELDSEETGLVGTAKNTVSDPKLIDRIAERSGFSSREPLERKIMRQGRVRKADTADTSVNIRCRIKVANRFKDYCEEEGLTQGEALQELMRQAGLL